MLEMVWFWLNKQCSGRMLKMFHFGAVNILVWPIMFWLVAVNVLVWYCKMYNKKWSGLTKIILVCYWKCSGLTKIILVWCWKRSGSNPEMIRFKSGNDPVLHRPKVGPVPSWPDRLEGEVHFKITLLTSLTWGRGGVGGSSTKEH